MNENLSKTDDDVKLTPGCLLALVLLAVAILGVKREWFLPGPAEGEFLRIFPGESFLVDVPTDLKTMNGLSRLRDVTASMTFVGEDEAREVRVEATNQDSWGAETQVELITVEGIPVHAGRDAITLGFRFFPPEGEEWVGRRARIEVAGLLEYPYLSAEEIGTGSVTGEVHYEERSMDDARELRLDFVSSEARAGDRARSNRTDGIFYLLGLIAVVLAFRSVETPSSEDEVDEAEDDSLEGGA